MLTMGVMAVERMLAPPPQVDTKMRREDKMHDDNKIWAKEYDGTKGEARNANRLAHSSEIESSGGFGNDARDGEGGVQRRPAQKWHQQQT